MTAHGGAYARARQALRRAPRRWLLTGAAGFIGSSLLQALLELGQEVTGLDDFSTGSRRNLDEALAAAGTAAAGRFRLLEGDVRDLELCRAACAGADVVLHQAARVSVPASIADPIGNHAVNVEGFLSVLTAARDAGVGRFVYASSSAVYGEAEGGVRSEDETPRPVSPYGLSKQVDELYADLFERMHGMRTVGLRYFNVFGPRQDPDGPYAAVIPRWSANLLAGEPCRVFGDGESVRDFCFVGDVVQANLLAATVDAPGAAGAVYNVARGESTSLNQLFGLLRDGLAPYAPAVAGARPTYEPPRSGDIRRSVADVSGIRERLGFAPSRPLADDLAQSLEWYAVHLAPGAPR